MNLKIKQIIILKKRKCYFEVIFFFNIKEKEKLVEEKGKESIKSHDIELFKQFIGYKNSNRDKIITYLIDYSFI